MFYVGLYQSRLVGRLVCPFLGEQCEGVADAPFARPFGIPDGYIGAALYIMILSLLLAQPARWVWIAPSPAFGRRSSTRIPRRRSCSTPSISRWASISSHGWPPPEPSPSRRRTAR
ncbi:hypothetical protein J6497_28340 [Bradyrhizobium sp. CNPSo 4026]|nr:hypothetical protein [Bradyrhizobium cenepequi]